MKRMKYVWVVLLVSLLSVMQPFSTGAEDIQNQDKNEVLSVEKEAAAVSYGLQIIAGQKEMAIAGIKGTQLYFDAERFACAMNLSEIEYITVTKLPDITCGSLYIGSDGVSEGQKINRNDIAMLTYEESKTGIGNAASFDFSVNGSAYEMTCNIYMIEDMNYSPTISLASSASLCMETYRNVKASGVLSAYDPDGDSITFEIVKYPENGRLVLVDEKQGTYTYIPNDTFSGRDSFLYVARDQYGNYSASAKVDLDVILQETATVYSDLIDHPLHSHAIAVTECGLMNGVRVGDHYYFEAEREVTRAEFLITAMKAIGIKNVPSVAETDFADDQDINNEMKGYVALAYSKGYISGKKYEGGVFFKPDEKIELSEAAVIISNMIGYAEPKIIPVFADADKIPEWSGKAIRSLHTLGILETPDMVSGADEAVTRGDMAKLLNKMMFVIEQY